MATATYRIGPSDFFTPSDLKADADTLNEQVEDLDAQVEGNENVPGDWLDQWLSFQGQWAAFYSNEFGDFLTNLLTAVNDANRDQLIQYEQRFSSFATAGASFGLQLTAPVSVSSGSQDTLGAQLSAQTKGAPSSTTIIVILIAAVALLVVWQVVK